MGTISDKLMRIINTKEDIRQALISKGYDVPTSIPFKEYAKMISDLPCRVDSFPDIEGIVARYSALGLTNEQMAANPVWVDKTGNGHDIQLKNFSWKGMSGVGGYEMNFNLWRNNVPSIPDISMSTTTTSVSVSVGNSTYNNNLIYIHISNWDINKNHWLKVTSTYEDGDLAFLFYNDKNTKKIGLPANGYVNILAYPEFKGNYMYISTISNKQGSFTIEQLPLYPGALVFDGVDDYGTCNNFPILTKEKGYTVVALRQYLVDKSTAYLTANGDSISNTSFILEGNNYRDTWSFGKATTIQASRILATQTSKQYDGVKLNIGTNTEGSNLLQVGKWSKSYSNVAIWELVFLDHDATEEELTKIKDYFVKTYPWLFPDQAWTVTGKTNEDEDRATIANITGNGNNLVLSNFGFSENSGYGSYPFGMNVWNPDYIADQPYGTVHYPNDSKSYATTVKNNATNFRIKFRLRGLPEGGSFLIRVFDMNDLNTVLKTYTYTENGIHEFVYNDPNKPARIILYNGNTISNISEFYLDIIPEYEGYLVTDGVDDKIVSSVFGMGKDFTIVGDWKFIDNKKSGTGLVKASSFYIYNTMIGLDLYINSGSVTNSLDGIKSINAACSDGRAYDRNWNEILANTGNVVGSGGILEVSSSGGRFDRIAFKNLAIYPRILSKDDCIKAYNYLQTLKAK